MNDLISIIVPVYNSSATLKRCINSLLNQTYKNIEIVCINDGSTDDSLNVLNELEESDKRIRIIDKKNEGVSIARNVGIKYSKGKFISFVDADDWIENDSIEKMYTAIIKNDVDVVRGNYQIEYKNGQEGAKGEICGLSNKVFNVKSDNFENDVIMRFLNGDMPCFVWLLMIKRDCIIKTRLFPENIPIWEDCIFYFELCMVINTVFFMDDITYHYCNNDSSCVRNPDYYLRNLYEILKVNKVLKDDFRKSDYKSDTLITIFNTRCLLMIVTFLINILKTNKMKSNEIIIEAKKICSLSDFKEIKNDIDLKCLSIYKRIPVVLMIKNRFKMMVLFFKFRKHMSILKLKLKGIKK